MNLNQNNTCSEAIAIKDFENSVLIVQTAYVVLYCCFGCLLFFKMFYSWVLLKNNQCIYGLRINMRVNVDKIIIFRWTVPFNVILKPQFNDRHLWSSIKGQNHNKRAIKILNDTLLSHKLCLIDRICSRTVIIPQTIIFFKNKQSRGYSEVLAMTPVSGGYKSKTL